VWDEGGEEEEEMTGMYDIIYRGKDKGKGKESSTWDLLSKWKHTGWLGVKWRLFFHFTFLF